MTRFPKTHKDLAPSPNNDDSRTYKRKRPAKPSVRRNKYKSLSEISGQTTSSIPSHSDENRELPLEVNPTQQHTPTASKDNLQNIPPDEGLFNIFSEHPLPITMTEEETSLQQIEILFQDSTFVETESPPHTTDTRTEEDLIHHNFLNIILNPPSTTITEQGETSGQAETLAMIPFVPVANTSNPLNETIDLIHTHNTRHNIDDYIISSKNIEPESRLMPSVTEQGESSRQIDLQETHTSFTQMLDFLDTPTPKSGYFPSDDIFTPHIFQTGTPPPTLTPTEQVQNNTKSQDYHGTFGDYKFDKIRFLTQDEIEILDKKIPPKTGRPKTEDDCVPFGFFSQRDYENSVVQSRFLSTLKKNTKSNTVNRIKSAIAYHKRQEYIQKNNINFYLFLQEQTPKNTTLNIVDLLKKDSCMNFESVPPYCTEHIVNDIGFILHHITPKIVLDPKNLEMISQKDAILLGVLEVYINSNYIKKGKKFIDAKDLYRSITNISKNIVKNKNISPKNTEKEILFQDSASIQIKSPTHNIGITTEEDIIHQDFTNIFLSHPSSTTITEQGESSQQTDRDNTQTFLNLDVHSSEYIIHPPSDDVFIPQIAQTETLPSSSLLEPQNTLTQTENDTKYFGTFGDYKFDDMRFLTQDEIKIIYKKIGQKTGRSKTQADYVPFGFFNQKDYENKLSKHSFLFCLRSESAKSQRTMTVERIKSVIGYYKRQDYIKENNINYDLLLQEETPKYIALKIVNLLKKDSLMDFESVQYPTKHIVNDIGFILHHITPKMISNPEYLETVSQKDSIFLETFQELETCINYISGGKEFINANDLYKKLTKFAVHRPKYKE